jgi:DNA (cytosine-5)-methyltransferase 1
MPSFYEFFAGGGMARAGLGPKWDCLFANDIDPKKCATYSANWGDGELKSADIHEIKAKDIPGRADLAWASFPCQDLSLAGLGAGLEGERSGAFWGFWTILKGLQANRRAPRLLVLENVVGALTSNGGKDFAAICRALAALNYDFGALVIDAAHFLPQSRPRLFIIAAYRNLSVPLGQKDAGASELWHPRALRAVQQALPVDLRKRWIWWRLPAPQPHGIALASLIEDNPSDVPWHSKAETARLLSQMSPSNRLKVQTAKKAGRRMIGTVYKRTRRDANGKKVQRAEIRFDDVAGCLRTPAGGSSRQIVLVVDGASVRSRLMSSREAVRLMGLPDSYRLSSNYNDAYHLAGDGVAVPVVQFIRANIFDALLSRNEQALVAAE